MNNDQEISETTKTLPLKERWVNYIRDLQDHICAGLEAADGQAGFKEDLWERAGDGGGGRSRVIENGLVFEKGGVNSSVVYGVVTDIMRTQLKLEGARWFASGLSLVIHPRNPHVPTIHANWRYFELYNESGDCVDSWFGGGTDLTPYYLYPEDAIHFHGVLKKTLDPYGSGLYPNYKEACDQYFSNHHRNDEMRGIGGIFYDYLRPANDHDAERLFEFQRSNGNAFLNAYLPIVDKRKISEYGETEITWQEIRRGRYVEFNLIHDRGTLFGLKTNGRTESILMSLPPRARWIYNYEPEAGSREYELVQACLFPRKWV